MCASKKKPFLIKNRRQTYVRIMTPEEYSGSFTKKMMAGRFCAKIKELMGYEGEHDGETPVWDEAAMGNKQTLERQIFLKALSFSAHECRGRAAHSRSRTLSIVWKAAAAVSIIGLSSYFIALHC